MKPIKDIMTADVRCVRPDASLTEAAKLMEEMDVGALPICEDERLAGMITDRDIVIRAVSRGQDPNTARVREVMSEGIVYLFEDQDTEEAARLFEREQIRRVPILNRDKRLVGFLSLGDLAGSADPERSGEALKEISEPAHT